jgi:endonuclease III
MIAVRRARVRRMHVILKRLFPTHAIELNYTTPWELMVAVQLSAQCTDKRVNEVTATLFKKYHSLIDYVNAKPRVFERDICQCGFYRNKTKNILAAATRLYEAYDGQVPSTMEELLTLPGIARKSANVILANLFDFNEGIAVDTHIRRFAIRFDLSSYKDPIRIERDLMDIVPKKDWWDFHHRLVLYGRYYCKANRHDCTTHPLTKVYPDATSRWPKAR